MQGRSTGRSPAVWIARPRRYAVAACRRAALRVATLLCGTLGARPGSRGCAEQPRPVHRAGVRSHPKRALWSFGRQPPTCSPCMSAPSPLDLSANTPGAGLVLFPALAHRSSDRPFGASGAPSYRGDAGPYGPRGPAQSPSGRVCLEKSLVISTAALLVIALDGFRMPLTSKMSTFRARCFLTDRRQVGAGPSRAGGDSARVSSRANHPSAFI